jgi:uncharacterized membrane protein
MIISASTSFVSAFLASFVEAVEALTIVLAAGSTRGWKPALMGASGALLLLATATAIGGPFLQYLPVQIVRLALGSFLLILGLRWLRKAVLRAAGIIPQRNESLAYARTEDRLRGHEARSLHFDSECFATSFAAVFIEGLEVVFIVLSLGAAGNALLYASSGAALACLSVVGLGWALHRPLTKIPENWFKFAVGILLTAFGLFWTADGLGIPWPGGDMALLGLVFTTSSLSALAVWMVRHRFRSRH